MVDWKGLLNWSLKYNDGTRSNEDIKPMSKEDMEFLQNAFESVCVNEMKEIWKILDECKKREGDSEKEINERIDLLNMLSSYLDGLENARNIVRGKRLNEIIDYFFDCKHKKVKIELGNILTQMTQNDGYVQKAALDLGIFKFLDELNKSEDPDLNKLLNYDIGTKDFHILFWDSDEADYNHNYANTSGFASLKTDLNSVRCVKD
jgi:hypothetical protein